MPRISSTSTPGVEVARVVPVKRIPKTTSGKLQRTALAEGYVHGEFDAEIDEFDRALRPRSTATAAPRTGASSSSSRRSSTRRCPASTSTCDDNLFEIGASSLKLIQIHEKIDELYPGPVDLTELFDFPTISQLAKHLEGKLAAA